ncbi:MAG: hypothetical protein ACTS73_04955 [Arsenophonus sp. NEOnobi-MAG3]
MQSFIEVSCSDKEAVKDREEFLAFYNFPSVVHFGVNKNDESD